MSNERKVAVEFVYKHFYDFRKGGQALESVVKELEKLLAKK